MARSNAVKGRLRGGEAVIGSFCNVPSPEAVEILGWAGLDFVIIDAEHGPADLETVTNMVRGAEASGTTPIVRVAMNEPQNILRHLDSGAQGLQVPMVNGPDDAQNGLSLRRCIHRKGRRGLAGVRAATFGLEESVPDYAVTANDEMLVIVQIETVEAWGICTRFWMCRGSTSCSLGRRICRRRWGYRGRRGMRGLWMPSPRRALS